MNIAFLDSETVGNDINLDVFTRFGTFTAYEYTKPDDTIPRLQGIDIAIVNKTKIDKNIIDKCPQLKLVCIAATGMNNIDLEYAAQKNITVKNVAGYSTDSVAQVTFAMLLSLMNRIPYFDNYVKSGCYSQNHYFTHYGRTFNELAGKQVGIIGLGTIGKKSALIAEAFGAKVVYHSTSGKNTSAGYLHLELNDLLKTSDVVLIHAPLNTQTKNLINSINLKLMKPSAFIINTGRGGIINEEDLAAAIDSRQIMGAGLDVFKREPMAEDSPFLKVKLKEHLILAPHVGWASIESRQRLIKGVVDNIKDYLSNQKK